MIMSQTYTAQMARLDYILSDNLDSIKSFADEITELLATFTDEQKLLYSSKIKSKVQIEAQTAWRKANCWGCVYAATGTGKSKIPINIVEVIFRHPTIVVEPKILLVVPTEKLRDENWHEEFKKWNCPKEYDLIERTCYASLDKYVGQTFDFVIFDESHNITENNSLFFKKNTVKSCILLTATRPTDPIKVQILKELRLLPVYELSLDESVKLGLIAPYDIIIVTTRLSTGEKYLKGGSKAKSFMQNEKEMYTWLDRVVKSSPNKFNFIRRMRFIYDLRSKTQAAQWILDYIIPRDLRTLIFCGTIKQAELVSDYYFHSKTDDKHFKMFKHDKSDDRFGSLSNKVNRLACVNSLNEGHNIENLDVAFIIQLNSNELHLIQRIGRLVRYRAGHIAKIIILCVEDTMDKNWVEKATANLAGINIKTIELSRLKADIEKINFD